MGVELEERRLIEVWNKIDLVEPSMREEIEGEALRVLPRAVPVSSVTGEGCDDLLVAIAKLVDEAPPVQVHTRAGEGAAIAWLYRHGRVLDRVEDADGGSHLAVRLSDQALGQFEQLFPHADLTH
jgi:GTP-binding protein HflX